jgi:hypothetical protein
MRIVGSQTVSLGARRQFFNAIETPIAQQKPESIAAKRPVQYQKSRPISERQ